MMRVRNVLLLSLLLCSVASAQSTGSGFNWGADLEDLTNNMVTRYGGALVSTGLWEVLVIYLMMVFKAWYDWGSERALSFAHHAHYPLPLPRIAWLSIKAAFLVWLLNNYITNFAGTGFSFHSAGMAVSKHITLLIDHSVIDSLMAKLSNPTGLVIKSINPADIVDAIVYLFVVWPFAGILHFCMFVLGGLGFIASGVFTIVGPIFIPLWLFNGHPNAWAWNWFQVMLASASYRVFGACLQAILAGIWMDFFNNTIGTDYSIPNWIAHGEVAIFLTLFTVLATTMVPVFAAQIFNGAGAFAQAATGAVTSAVSKGAELAKIIAA